MAQAAVVVICDICETDQDVQFYCINCEENMCKTCKMYHSKSKKTRNDKIILISEARREKRTKTPLIFCVDHSTEEVSIYCRQCDQLICTECLNDNHEGHNLASLKQINNTATDQLVDLRKRLRDKKCSIDQVFEAEGKIHSNYLASIKQCKIDISDQKEKIIEELNIICDEDFAVLISLDEKETTRYSEACTNIQKQQQIVTTALQTVQNGIDSGHPASMLQAKNDATELGRGIDDLTPAQLYSPEFQQAHMKRQALRQHLGRMYTILSGTSQKQAITKQKSDDKTLHVPNYINKREINDEVKIRSTITVKGKAGRTKVIVPTKNNCTWVSAPGDTKLTMINDKGDIVKTSVTVDSSGIVDAKAYNNDILVTCNREQVFRLSEDGTKKSSFSNLQPYMTYGLCVTNEMDVLVCLYLSELDNKVVKLGKNGKIIQTIQKDSTGRPHYSCPYRVTEVPSGEILVTQSNPGKVTCVDKNGQHLFTWTGQIEGRQADKFSTYGITQDNYNVFVADYLNSKVYVLKRDGTGAKCLLDNRQEIVNPWGLALDDYGQLLIGCNYGKIHKIEY